MSELKTVHAELRELLQTHQRFRAELQQGQEGDSTTESAKARERRRRSIRILDFAIELLEDELRDGTA